MEKVKIKNFTDVITGGTPSTSRAEYWENGNIPWLNSGELNQKFVTTSRNYITKLGLEKCSSRLMPKDTVLMALTGSTTGVVGYLTFEACANQSVTGILPSKKHDSKYLYHYLNHIRPKVVNDAYGGAQPHISQGYVKDLEIPLPGLPTQQKIANILDKADELRQFNQQLIEKYDALIHSLFLEMFGDMAHNNSQFPQIPLIDLVADKHDIKCGPFGTQLSKSEYVEYGVPIWGIPQINSRFKKKPTEYITIQKAEILKQYSVLPSDLIMSRKGNVGKCAIYPNWEMGILHSDALRIRCHKDKISPIFLAWQFRISRSLETQVNDVSSGAIMAGINVSKLKNIQPIVPPIELQNQFAERVQLIETQKQQAQEALAKSEALFQGLLQQAFNGE
jgi:type I restriction enzyme S subunit